DLAKIGIKVFQDIGSDARPLFDESQEDMLGADVLVIEALRLLVGELHHLTSTVGKTFIHCDDVLRQPVNPTGELSVAASSREPKKTGSAACRSLRCPKCSRYLRP